MVELFGGDCESMSIDELVVWGCEESEKDVNVDGEHLLFCWIDGWVYMYRLSVAVLNLCICRFEYVFRNTYSVDIHLPTSGFVPR